MLQHRAEMSMDDGVVVADKAALKSDGLSAAVPFFYCIADVRL